MSDELTELREFQAKRARMTEELAAKYRALADATRTAEERTDDLYDLITYVRGVHTTEMGGKLTINQMAEAMVRDRNYVDSVWSDRDKNREVHGSWFALSDNSHPDKVLAKLAAYSNQQRGAVRAVKDARAERDELIVDVYLSKVMGPSLIAQAVKVDRNHVGRIVSRAGVGPLHRTKVRNQYSPADTAA